MATMPGLPPRSTETRPRGSSPKQHPAFCRGTPYKEPPVAPPERAAAKQAVSKKFPGTFAAALKPKGPPPQLPNRPPPQLPAAESLLGRMEERMQQQADELEMLRARHLLVLRQAGERMQQQAEELERLRASPQRMRQQQVEELEEAACKPAAHAAAGRGAHAAASRRAGEAAAHAALGRGAHLAASRRAGEAACKFAGLGLWIQLLATMRC